MREEEDTVKPFVSILASLLLLILTSGCWDNNELDEYGFVQAVAIDRSDDHLIELTTHLYNPSSKMEMGDEAKPAQKSINFRTTGETFFEALREIPAEFGRKAKWDHMRVIIIGEKLAKTINIREVLDFFSRDHEPRGTVLPLIAEKSAADFLDVKPFIEQTIGQQYKKMETNGARYSAKTSSIPLYELAIQMKSPSKTSAVPYIHKNSLDHKAVVSGTALIQDGKMVELLKERDTEALMMLTQRYRFGIIEFPCMKHDNEQVLSKESFEVLTFHSSVTPTLTDDSVSIKVQISMEGTVGELRCSHLKTNSDMEHFEQIVEDTIEQQITHTINVLKRKKVDAIGIGNQLYRKNPKRWKQLEPDWEERFARSEFEVDVKVKVLSTGMNSGTIFGTKEK
ncbi:Ger(x)C family spore germination protein [Paenibacillaceae bacterium]|nr:Ger(x)C family spore germination protein [Paenibacillaceae bacterium]